MLTAAERMNTTVRSKLRVRGNEEDNKLEPFLEPSEHRRMFSSTSRELNVNHWFVELLIEAFKLFSCLFILESDPGYFSEHQTPTDHSKNYGPLNLQVPFPGSSLKTDIRCNVVSLNRASQVGLSAQPQTHPSPRRGTPPAIPNESGVRKTWLAKFTIIV